MARMHHSDVQCVSVSVVSFICVPMYAILLSVQVQLHVPFASTALSTRASFEVRSPKLLSVRFEQGSVATPQLLEGVELPKSVSVMGQTIDLTPLQVCLVDK